MCFFFNVPPTTEIYPYCHTLSLHYALPIYRVHVGARGFGGKIDIGGAEARQDARDQRLGRGIERPRMDDDVVHVDVRKEQRRDRRHAGGEDERVLCLFPDAQPRLEDFLVRSEEHTSELQTLMRISYAVF